MPRWKFIPLDQRLLERREIDSNGCWNWTGGLYTRNRGYGGIWASGGMRRVHRAAFEVWVGPIPSGLLVCHRCDNPRCFNPAHLFLGTIQDNNRDKVEKMRTVSGESHHRTKLSDADLTSIVGSSEPTATIAVKYGISDSYAYRIKTGKASRLALLARRSQ